MSTLVDFEISKLIYQGVITGLPESELLNSVSPNSLDIRIGTSLKREVRHPFWVEWFYKHFPSITSAWLRPCQEWVDVDISDKTPDNPYWLKPGEFILVDSMEVFHFPDNIKAEFFLRSSAGRQGYEHAMAGYCDSGWSGSRLTMELTNLRRYRCLPIYPGLKLGQLAFERLSQTPIASYRKKGRYNNDLNAQESKGL